MSEISETIRNDALSNPAELSLELVGSMIKDGVITGLTEANAGEGEEFTDRYADGLKQVLRERLKL